MNKQLKILVEFTVENPVGELDPEVIKSQVEAALGTVPALTQYLHSVGNYHDAEVVQVIIAETYDTRQ